MIIGDGDEGCEGGVTGEEGVDGGKVGVRSSSEFKEFDESCEFGCFISICSGDGLFVLVIFFNTSGDSYLELRYRLISRLPLP